MEVEETKCKSILSKSDLYDVDYTINPYTGCEHGCKYCYAKFMRKFTNHKEPWGEFVDIKTNSRKILEKDLMKKGKGSILISSVTDPYQPLEKEYELTRKILKRLSNTKFPVTILTKSDLILRDVDILKDFKEKRIQVGFTINFLNEEDGKIWEPNSPKPKDRIKALKQISKKGIDSYVHIGPYFEGITDLEEIAKEVGEYVSELQIEGINLKDNEREIINTIKENYPALKENYEKIARNYASYEKRLSRKVRELGRTLETPISLFL